LGLKREIQLAPPLQQPRGGEQIEFSLAPMSGITELMKRQKL
jgi:hypothetical protein